MAEFNDPDIPLAINHKGLRKQWVGIGWVTEGAPKGDEVLVVERERQPISKTKYEVVQHPRSKKHLLFKVTTRAGYVYACASACEPDTFPKPNEASVQYHWKHSRHDFLPYDESSGKFTA